MKHKSIQPKWNKAIKSTLTPDEIKMQAGDYTSFTTSWESVMYEMYGYTEDNHLSRNPRTGLRCEMIYSEEEHEAIKGKKKPRYVYKYIVELNTGDGYVLAYFESHTGNQAEMAYLRKEAEKTFIAWSALIGVKVEYKLCAQVPATDD
jgi:hypothetical protein